MNLERFKSEVQTRSFYCRVDGSANEKKRTVQLAFSSEEPYLRSFGWEVLDHSTDSMRTDRLRAGAPLLVNHDSTDQVGVVESISIDADRRARAVVRFGRGVRANEIFNDVVDGIRTQISVGYKIHDYESDGIADDGIEIIRVTDWEPYELSSVSIAADATVGIGRNNQEFIMETENLSRSERKRENHVLEENQNRESSIRSLAGAFGDSELADTAIAEGWTEERYRLKLLKTEGDRRNNSTRVESAPDYEGTRSHTPNAYMGMGMPCDNSQYGRAMGNYSITRLLRGLADPKALDDCGLELEISRDMENVLGKRTSGILMPYEALQKRAITIGGTGSNLVPEDHLSGSFIDVLRNSSRVMALNPTVLRGLIGNVDIPRKVSGGAAYWFAADGSDSITESTPTFDTVSLTPKTVGGAISFSHKTIVQSSPDIEMLVRQDLADLIASEIDLKALTGSGASSQPTGVLNTSGIGAVDFVADDPTYAEVLAMETSLANANSDVGNLAWLMDPDMAEALKTTPKQGSGVEGNFIWNDGGMVAGIPAHRTANMTSGYMLLGNWSQLLVGFWGGIELAADGGGTNFLKGSVTVRVLADVDMGVRHPGAFCEGHNAA